MLSDKDFFKEIWNKYEIYSQKQNKDDFFSKHVYRNTEHIRTIRVLASFFIIISTSVGVVYGSIYLYNKIWKEPEKINYQQEQEVTEEDINQSISQEKAKEVASEFLNRIGIEDIIENVEYIKYPTEGKAYWKIITSKKYEVKINANDGKISSYYNGTIDDSKIKSTIGKEEATKIAINLYNRITNDRTYELKEINRLGTTENSCLWMADFCKSYDGVFNDYQCIRITFIPEMNTIKILNIFDENFENNTIEISKQEAVEIVKNKLIDKEVVDIICELEIRKMNAYVYMQDNPIEGGEAYKTDNLVRKVWTVQTRIRNKNIDEVNKYFVDCTTGEIIGGDSIK